jgi:hypothetical protein
MAVTAMSESDVRCVYMSAASAAVAQRFQTQGLM